MKSKIKFFDELIVIDLSFCCAVDGCFLVSGMIRNFGVFGLF